MTAKSTATPPASAPEAAAEPTKTYLGASAAQVVRLAAEAQRREQMAAGERFQQNVECLRDELGATKRDSLTFGEDAEGIYVLVESPPVQPLGDKVVELAAAKGRAARRRSAKGK